MNKKKKPGMAPLKTVRVCPNGHETTNKTICHVCGSKDLIEKGELSGHSKEKSTG